MAQVKPLRASIHNHRLYLLFGFLGIAYFSLIFFTNPAQNLFGSLHLSQTDSRLMSILIRLPLEVIWLTILYGYLRLANYTKLLGNHIDGKNFKAIQHGLLTLTVGLPFIYVSANFWTLLRNQGVVSQAVVTFFSNYLQLGVMATAFVLISYGVHCLAATVPHRPRFMLSVPLTLLGITVGATYCFLVANNINNPLASAHVNNLWHYLNPYLVIFTFVIPYLFIWTIGSHSVYQLARYQQLTKGKLYKTALRNLTTGLAVVISMNIILQFVNTLSRQSLNFTDLTMFVIAYITYAIIGLGYILIAIGARRLQKIEEA